MKKIIVLVFMTVCALTSPMMVKQKRDLNTEGGSTGDAVRIGGRAANTEGGAASTEGGAASTDATATSTAATTNHTEICAPQTPCAWSAYHTYTKALVWNIRNKYCVCGPGTDCYVDEDDKQDYAYVYRCRTPPEDTNTVLERSI